MRESISSLDARANHLRQGYGGPTKLHAKAQAHALRVVGITAGLLTVAPASALACPVCALVGPSDNTWAYQAMSAMLIFLPLAMIGAIVWWLARLATRADAERSSATRHVVDSDPLVQGTSPTRRGPRPVGSYR